MEHSIEDKMEHTLFFIKLMIDGSIKDAKSKVDGFKEWLKDDSLTYALAWRGMDGSIGDFELKILRYLPEKVADMLNSKSDKSVEDLSEAVLKLKEEAEYFLIEGASWRPNSTGPMSNVMNIAEGLAQKNLHDFFRRVLREIDVYKELKSQLK